MSQRERNYRIGRGLFQRGEIAPLRPSDAEADNIAAWLWYGWMMARAEEIQKIFNRLDRVGIRHTPHGDRECARLVAALDRKHRFKTITATPPERI
jgi:hypothetical protein